MITKTNCEEIVLASCRENGISMTLSFDMPAGYESAYGTYDVTINTLFLNIGLLEGAPEYEVLFYLFHELRHAMQYLCPSLFDAQIQESRFYIVLYNGVCYKLAKNEWQKCKLEGSEEYFTHAYLSMPYELDANTFAYEKIKELYGNTVELQELYAFFLPQNKFDYSELKQLFQHIDNELAKHKKQNENDTKINCVWEHNGSDTLLYATDYVGAYTRGENLEAATKKMTQEISSYCKWRGEDFSDNIEVVIAEEKESDLAIRDADSDVLFETEKAPLSAEEYQHLKALALKSAQDFLTLYHSIPDKDATASSERKTFYGQVPRSANEMYEHTKSVNAYYFAEINVDADNAEDIFDCRRRGFEALERKADFLENATYEGSYGENWSLRKVLRRFIWHDRIHARAMYRMATKVFGAENIANPFYF